MSDTSFGVVNNAFVNTESQCPAKNKSLENDLTKPDDFSDRDHDYGLYKENRSQIKDGDNNLDIIEKEHASNERQVKTDAVLDFIYKLRGPAFRSMRDKKLKRVWRRASLKEDNGDAEM